MDRHDRGRATSLIGHLDDHGVVYERVKPMREVVGEENFADDSSKVDECSRTLRGGRCRLLSRLILSVKDGRRSKGST